MSDRFNTFDDDIELDLNVSLEERLSVLNLKENKNETKNNKKRPIDDSEIFTSRKRHKTADKNYEKAKILEKTSKKVSSEINELYYV